MPPEIDYEKCTGCGICREVCAEDVFFDTIENPGVEKPAVTYPEACFHCYLCVQECPAEAVSVRTPLQMHVPYK